jgi:hypothetical protein
MIMLFYSTAGVRKWPDSDLPACPPNVRYRGQSGRASRRPGDLSLTQDGHRFEATNRT